MPRATRTSRTSQHRDTPTPGVDGGGTPIRSTLISTQELAAHLDDPRLVILDVRHDLAQAARRGENEFSKAHLPGALFVDVDRDLAAARTGRNGRHPLPTPETVGKLFSRLGIDASKQVVAYDQDSGMFAARLWWMLRWLGHDAVAVLDGGYAKWLRENRPVSAELRTPRPAAFAAGRVLPTLNATGIAASLPRHTLLLMDARSAERYRGDAEPLDPVAGHIPGAFNRPYTRNVTPDGTFRPAQELRSEFDSILHGRTADDVVHYCGSGITACHNLLAMAIAGHPLTRLYPGSWSEWCSDPRRPVARGQV